MPTGGTARKPVCAVHGEQRVLAEIDRRAPKRGMRKSLAQDAGISESFLSLIASGNRPMTPRLADELGFTLAWVRMEELELLAKLERELSRPDRLKELVMARPACRKYGELYLPRSQTCSFGNHEELARRKEAEIGSQRLAKAIQKYFERRAA